ncbi:hypothetical protein BATDEDRAFT_91387 [Batrachochytrium dendrobatidis JAM81]|uniref:Rho-GAP domain-containing protein n=1 Tax=Batrachochytrium dendrobatidis (strain JAM81 / FGSC 10211) TaxID=684364 RepID=F4PAQ7_BATDJ|nr:uncharacterized protein BATDEDRAFT_91387 [Batrachochytrium dendrobatidis JAM81]EGF77726.1 hypothetical protein BATDEDRAFT_91387 [Batrachochytrium dendrobatidis JAM81]|eukprot:XP_006681818.1 hypothetical protein BATDEDRAFT_91387 [Batrachochytrium dendrobatidis JAM81]
MSSPMHLGRPSVSNNPIMPIIANGLRRTSSTTFCEITDPQTGKTFYANLLSGECSWELPQNARIEPRDPTGQEWWELFDEGHKLLIAIQNSAIGKRLSLSFNPATSYTPNNYETGGSSNENMFQARMGTSPKEHHSQKASSHSGNLVSDAGLMRSTPSLTAVQNARSMGISGPVNSPDAAQAMHPFSQNNIQNTQSMSLPALQSLRTLPPKLLQDITQFKIDGFAKKYFSEHRRGIFRRKVPLEKMLIFQKDALKAPLMQLRPSLHKDAIKCFKAIQKIMNPRVSLESQFVDIQELLEKGIRIGGLRDEICVQLCKQLTKNPSNESLKRGWQLMDIICSTFPPSKNLDNYLKNFIQQHFGIDGPGSQLDTIIRHTSGSLLRTSRIGPRGRTMTPAEINQVLEAPFKNSVFGDTLENIMERQIKSQPTLELPRILLFLSDAILSLNGCQTEGIFRVPGDAEAVSDLRCRIDKDEYRMDGIHDPNAPSSLLKLWLRELAEPLIPGEYYDGCIQVGQQDGHVSSQDLYIPAIRIVDGLPDINRKVVRFMIQFLKIIAEARNQPITKMTVGNLAMVFAPNFLRCPSDNPATIFENTKFEQAFLKVLMVGGHQSDS